MSNNSGLMDTEPGGEQTQYEGEYTDVLPPKKLAGQFGGHPPTPPSTSTTTPPNKPAANPNQESLAADQPARSTGEASTEGGFGGTKALHAQSADPGKTRREQGYGGERDMDANIGA